MVTFESAKHALLSKYTDSIIETAMELDGKYLFCIRPKDLDRNTILADPYFMVDDSGVHEYPVLKDMKEFKNFTKNIVYKRGD